jgi:hypothetical protein
MVHLQNVAMARVAGVDAPFHKECASSASAISGEILRNFSPKKSKKELTREAENGVPCEW